MPPLNTSAFETPLMKREPVVPQPMGILSMKRYDWPQSLRSKNEVEESEIKIAKKGSNSKVYYYNDGRSFLNPIGKQRKS